MKDPEEEDYGSKVVELIVSIIILFKAQCSQLKIQSYHQSGFTPWIKSISLPEGSLKRTKGHFIEKQYPTRTLEEADDTLILILFLAF